MENVTENLQLLPHKQSPTDPWYVISVSVLLMLEPCLVYNSHHAQELVLYMKGIVKCSLLMLYGKLNYVTCGKFQLYKCYWYWKWVTSKCISSHAASSLAQLLTQWTCIWEVSRLNCSCNQQLWLVLHDPRIVLWNGAWQIPT